MVSVGAVGRSAQPQTAVATSIAMLQTERMSESALSNKTGPKRRMKWGGSVAERRESCKRGWRIVVSGWCVVASDKGQDRGRIEITLPNRRILLELTLGECLELPHEFGRLNESPWKRCVVASVLASSPCR